jgi:coenzyme F420-reducing hydrogenase alpha subunit
MKKIIKISRIEKIEGHGGFFADLLNGDVRNARIKVGEGARLIEAIVRGRNYEETPYITSRICGICSVAHNLTAIKALEDAFEVEITPQAGRLRKLLILAEFIQSHAAHVFFLAMADYFRLDTDLNLIKKKPKLAGQVLLIRDLGNKIKEAIGGRYQHMLTSKVGGFTRVPEDKDLIGIQKMIEPAMKGAVDLVKELQRLKFPKYERQMDFAALSSKKDYALYDGDISFSGEIHSDWNFYEALFEEERRDPVKAVQFDEKYYLVGALARINLHPEKLNKEAKKYLKFLGKLPNYNTILNTYAQGVEIIHCLREAENLINDYLTDKSRKVFTKYRVKAGRGLGVTEAPRGLLFHDYTVDKYGQITRANIITPTAQLISNLEIDLKKFLGENLNKKEQKRLIEMMVRAYDPCLTCAVH